MSTQKTSQTGRKPGLPELVAMGVGGMIGGFTIKTPDLYPVFDRGVPSIFMAAALYCLWRRRR